MSKIRALIVDDPSVMRKIVGRPLRQGGIEWSKSSRLDTYAGRALLVK